MKTYKIKICIVLCFFSLSVLAQTASERKYTEAEKEVVREFMATVEMTRDKFNEIQDRAPLHTAPYTETEEVIRKAEQWKNLLDDGHYIEVSKLKAWIPKLNELVDDDTPEYMEEEEYNYDRWNKSLSRSEEVIKRGEELIRTGRERIKQARIDLEDLKKSGDINDDVYYKKEARIDSAEGRLNKLEQRIEQEKVQMENWRKTGEGMRQANSQSPKK